MEIGFFILAATFFVELGLFVLNEELNSPAPAGSQGLSLRLPNY